MPRITFRKTGDDEAVIRYGGEAVGELYRHPDPVTGRSVYLVSIYGDGRPWVSVHDRDRVHGTIRRRLRSHPLDGWLYP